MQPSWAVKQMQMQMEGAGVAAAEAAQPEPAVGPVLDGGVEAVEEDSGEDLPLVLHKAWGAPRRRLSALNEVLGVELQPKVLSCWWQ